MKEEINFKYNDGGRALAGYKGDTGDCVARAICIASELPYQKVYDDLTQLGADWRIKSNSRAARNAKPKNDSVRNGCFKDVYKPYLEKLGWIWTPTMFIGSGCKVHLKASELPKGRIICSLSRHIVAVTDGIIQDTYDCSRDGTRCVYGYFAKL